MWKIKLENRDDGLKTLLHYNTFASLNKVLSFQLSNSEEGKPVEINFVVKRAKDKKDFAVDIGDFVNNSTTLTYYNPSIGTSGLTEPIIILQNEIYYFKVMYNLTMLNNSDTYELSIEFFIQKR